MKYLFLDCESAGLRGEIFAASLIGRDGEVLFDGFYRHNDLETNSWLRENVAPNLTGTEFRDVDNANAGKTPRRCFLEAFASAYNAARETHGNGEYNALAVVAHCGAPVEANFFQQLFEEGLIGEFDGPYPLLDTAPLLIAAGYDPSSEQQYAKDKNLALPKGYVPHSALSDAQLTRIVWLSLLNKC